MPFLISVYDLATISCDADEARRRGSRRLKSDRGDDYATQRNIRTRTQCRNNGHALPPSRNHCRNRTAAQRPAYIDGPPTTVTGEIISAAPGVHEGNGADETHGKNWGPPYKAIFTSSAKGFEMGENRRFKQRVFKFNDKPDAETLAALKDNGFTYRPEEKAWTIHADAESRLLTDRLALQFAGGAQEITR